MPTGRGQTTGKPTPPRSVPSGAVGGPATAGGIGYQIAYALYQALGLIADHLSTPFVEHTISLEPRELTIDGDSRWDVGIGVQNKKVELKLNPSRSDILEWLSRIGRATEDPAATFELVYSRSSGALVASLAGLIRIAQEAGGDDPTFFALVEAEHIKDRQLLTDPLGDRAAAILRKAHLVCIPESVVEENIAARAEILCPEHARLLATTLREKFLKGCQARKTYSVRDLIAILRSAGVSFYTPRERQFNTLPEDCRAALAVLQACPGGLPNQVMAAAISKSTDDVQAALKPLIDYATVSFDGERWRILMELPKAFAPVAAFESALNALVAYIVANDSSSAGRRLVHDAVALTRACYQISPKTIVGTFRKLEKLLKRLGDKHLVQELADLTVAAAAREPRDIEDAKAHAHALICGISWVHQRTGELDAARVLARKSLDLGEQINWDRNTAFCLKCEGRIMRLQAESDTEHAGELLVASAKAINHAIDQFSTMTEIGPTHAEIGDCFSLLARTYYVARQYDDAKEALRKAYDLIPPNGSKDHLDLLILTGDLYAATGDFEAAENTYSEVLSLPEAADVQVSEMFARCHFQRAKIRERLRRNVQAIRDYECAASIWLRLEEYENSARARWREIYLREPEQRAVIDEIAREDSFLVRVTAYQLYLDRFPAPKAIARRKQPSSQQIAQLMKDARMQTAIRYPHR